MAIRHLHHPSCPGTGLCICPPIIASRDWCPRCAQEGASCTPQLGEVACRPGSCPTCDAVRRGPVR